MLGLDAFKLSQAPMPKALDHCPSLAATKRLYRVALRDTAPDRPNPEVLVSHARA